MRSLTPKEIGALVREARTAAGLTQAQLADRIGASRFWVAAFEHGKPRAELGLALKAVSALNLVATIEPRAPQVRTAGTPKNAPASGYQLPVVDLAALLTRAATPVPFAAPRRRKKR